MEGTLLDALYLTVARVHVHLSRERGQTLAEYGLIVTLIAVAVTTLAIIAFRVEIQGAWNSASNCLQGSCGG